MRGLKFWSVSASALSLVALAGCGGGNDIVGGNGNGTGGGGTGGGSATGIIAFRVTTGTAGDIATIPASGGAATKITLTPQEEESPAISPDRTRIAYYRRTGNQALTSELWIANINGTNQRKLADGAPAFKPDWSPDGTRIAFFGRGNSVQTISAAGGAPTTLVASTRTNGELSWTPDGSQIAYDANTGGGPQIGIVNASGGAPRVLFSGARLPNFSPDGTLITYTAATGIFVRKADGTGAPTLVVADGIDSDFSPDSKSVVYVAQRGGGGGAEGSANLFRRPVAGGTETQLTSTGDALQPSWN